MRTNLRPILPQHLLKFCGSIDRKLAIKLLYLRLRLLVTLRFVVLLGVERVVERFLVAILPPRWVLLL